jgi:hypothetical protein
VPNRGYTVRDAADGFVAHFWNVKQVHDPDVDVNMTFKTVKKDINGESVVIPMLYNHRVIQENDMLAWRRVVTPAGGKGDSKGRNAARDATRLAIAATGSGKRGGPLRLASHGSACAWARFDAHVKPQWLRPYDEAAVKLRPVSHCAVGSRAMARRLCMCEFWRALARGASCPLLHAVSSVNGSGFVHDEAAVASSMTKPRFCP